MEELNDQTLRNIYSVSKRINRVAANIGQQTWGYRSGLRGLDEALLGFHGGELIIVAGRPSIGKSSLATQVATGISKHIKTLYFSLELSAKVVMERMLCQYAGLNYYNIKKNGLDDTKKMDTAVKEIADRQLFIDDAPSLNPEQFDSIVQQHDIECAIIDYVQLTSSPAWSENRVKEIDNICRELRATAKTKNIPVILLAQLNRQVEQRKEHKPMLCDLRDSGSIEQLAQVVILIHRPDFYEIRELGMDVDEDYYSELIIAKNYNGPTGKVECAFNPKSMSFIDKSEFV